MIPGEIRASGDAPIELNAGLDAWKDMGVSAYFGQDEKIAGEAAGVLMPSGCRMGICFGCVVPLREGAVRDLRTGEITSTDENSGTVPIQTCVSAAAGACAIDL